MGLPGMELTLRRKTGAEVPVDIHLEPVVRLHGVCVIVTIRRRP
jgi:hypothetical protein